MLKSFSFLLFLFIAAVNSGLAQPQKIGVPTVVKWEFTYEPVAGSEQEFILKLTATIDKGWHLYSQQVGADGPIPTSFKFNADEKKFQLVGATTEPAGETKHDEAFGAEIKSFEGTAVFTQKIKRNGNGALKITGEVEFMTCNNSQCLPPRSVAFTISIPEK